MQFIFGNKVYSYTFMQFMYLLFNRKRCPKCGVKLSKDWWTRQIYGSQLGYGYGVNNIYEVVHCDYVCYLCNKRWPLVILERR